MPEISRAIKKLNENRGDRQKIILLLDAVHGFGIEKESFKDLGCDFFITSCHKWTYGPRGTGLIATTPYAWQQVAPVIPSYTGVMDRVIEGKERPAKMDGK